MAFTDRFIKLPIKVYSTKELELTGKAEYSDNAMYVLPLEICSFKTVIDEDNDNVECVSIILKNGTSFYVYLTLKEFLTALDKHQK